MKKTFIFLTAICLTVFSQTTFAQGAEIGLKGGINFANLSGELQDYSFDNATSFHGGLYARFMLNDNFGIQPEALFSRVGGEAASGQVSLRYDYFSLPVMARFKIAGPVYAHIGPQFNFLTASEAKGDLIGTITQLDPEEDSESFDLSLAFGIDVNLPIGLNVGARYLYGLSDVYKDANANDVNHRVFQFYIAKRLFGLGSR